MKNIDRRCMSAARGEDDVAIKVLEAMRLEFGEQCNARRG